MGKFNRVFDAEYFQGGGYTNEHGVYYPVRSEYRATHRATGQTFTSSDPIRDFSKSCVNPNFNNYKTGVFIACRKCEECLRRRRFRWYFKAVTEIDTWPRTWFITLTFATVPSEPYEDIQKWLKNLRKKYRKPLKYLCTTEYGSKNGRLHYHLLVHCDETLTRRAVESDWKSGYSKAKLVPKPSAENATTKHPKSFNKAAGYVTKYLLKADQKLRSSQHYGKGFENIPF